MKRKKRRVIDGELDFYLFGKYYNKVLVRKNIKKFRLPRKLKKEIWKLHFLYIPNSEPIDLNWDAPLKKTIVVKSKLRIWCKEGAIINRNTRRLIKVCCRIINNYRKFENKMCMERIKHQREMIDMLKDEFMKISGIDADLYEKRKGRRTL